MNESRMPTLLKIAAVVFTVLALMFSTFALGLVVGGGLNLTPVLAAMRGTRPASQAEPPLTGTNSPAPSAPAGENGELIDLKLVREAWDLLQKQFYGELPQGKEITYDALRGMVERLGDPHTSFLDPEHAAMVNSDMEGHFEGIGARVANAEGGGVLITYLFPEQPAEKAGLRVGDVIMAVDGKDVTRLTATEAVTQIRGPGGSVVTLTVRRETRETFDVPVTRARIEIPVVDGKTVGDGQVEYIALSEFSAVSTNRLTEALNKALAKKPKGIVLDLRGNPGGLLDASVRIGSLFVPDGDILIERFKDGTERRYERTGRYLLGNTPLVVLVDAGSASASEIVAGAIQDAGTGILMGEKTYGKGSVQQPNSLSDGSQLRVTIAHWFTPKDRAIDLVGLTPDFLVRMTMEDRQAQRDPQLDAAVEYLLTGKTPAATPTPVPVQRP